MKAEADQSQQRRHGEMVVAWWVWPCGCRVVGVSIAWVCKMGLAALAWWQRHCMGSSKVSRLSLSFFFFFLKSLSLSLSCLNLRFSFLFFLLFFYLDFGDWSLWSDCWVYIFGLKLFFFLHVGWRARLQFQKGPSLFFFFFGKLTYLNLFIYVL